MAKQKEISTLVGLIIIIVAAVVLLGGAFTYEYVATSKADSLLQASLQIQIQNTKNNK